MNITFNDISKRIRNRGSKSTGSSITPRLYTEHNVFCTNNAVTAIMNWESLAENSNEAFNKALDIFEEVCLNENASTINKCASYLIENLDKVRDAGQLERSLKIRAGRLNNKITTKVNKGYDPVNNAIKNSIDAEVYFNNTFNEQLNGGTGLVNSFAYNSESGEWTHSASVDSTP